MSSIKATLLTENYIPASGFTLTKGGMFFSFSLTVSRIDVDLIREDQMLYDFCF